ncbi:MAG: rRNA maturation RNase YbeY [Bdellovibrionota bacterium]
MRLTLINRSASRLPKKFLTDWAKSLGKEKVFRSVRKDELVIVFVDALEMKTLNKSYRKKNYATDVLSFESDEDGVVGELVICPQVIAHQAKEHGLLIREELAYMVLHGLLHLMGLDHERSEREAKKMFKLQDEIFERLL